MPSDNPLQSFPMPQIEAPKYTPPADLGPEPAPPSGWQGKGGQIANIAQNLLHGWLAGVNLKKMREIQSAVNTVNNQRETVNNLMTAYHDRLAGGESETSPAMVQMRKAIGQNVTELTNSMQQYTMDEEPKGKGGKVKQRLKEGFTAGHPQMFKEAAIQALSGPAAKVAQSGDLEAFKLLPLQGTTMTLQDRAMKSQTEFNETQTKQAQQDAQLRDESDKIMSRWDHADDKSKHRWEDIQFRLGRGQDVYNKYLLEQSRTSQAELDEKSKLMAASKAGTLGSAGRQRLTALTAKYEQPQVSTVMGSNGYQWVISAYPSGEVMSKQLLKDASGRPIKGYIPPSAVDQTMELYRFNARQYMDIHKDDTNPDGTQKYPKGPEGKRALIKDANLASWEVINKLTPSELNMKAQESVQLQDSVLGQLRNVDSDYQEFVVGIPVKDPTTGEATTVDHYYLRPPQREDPAFEDGGAGDAHFAVQQQKYNQMVQMYGQTLIQALGSQQRAHEIFPGVVGPATPSATGSSPTPAAPAPGALFFPKTKGLALEFHEEGTQRKMKNPDGTVDVQVWTSRAKDPKTGRTGGAWKQIERRRATDEEDEEQPQQMTPPPKAPTKSWKDKALDMWHSIAPGSGV